MKASEKQKEVQKLDQMCGSVAIRRLLLLAKRTRLLIASLIDFTETRLIQNS